MEIMLSEYSLINAVKAFDYIAHDILYINSWRGGRGVERTPSGFFYLIFCVWKLEVHN